MKEFDKFIYIYIIIYKYIIIKNKLLKKIKNDVELNLSNK